MLLHYSALPSGVEMQSESEDREIVAGTLTTIRRITADGVRWRVQVETWAVDDGCGGRFVFRLDEPETHLEPRFGPATLRGETPEELIAEAYGVPERRLRELVHSLS